MAAVVGLDVDLDVPVKHPQLPTDAETNQALLADASTKLHQSLRDSILRPLVDIIDVYSKAGLHLVAKDGTKFRVVKHDAQISDLLKTVYTSGPSLFFVSKNLFVFIDDQFLEVEVEYPSAAVAKVVEYLVHQKGQGVMQRSVVRVSDIFLICRRSIIAKTLTKLKHEGFLRRLASGFHRHVLERWTKFSTLERTDYWLMPASCLLTFLHVF
jgi:hypothetical protein